MTIEERIRSLEEKTVERGCSEAEAESAKNLLKKLKAKLGDKYKDINISKEVYIKKDNDIVFNSDRYDIIDIKPEKHYMIIKDKINGYRHMIDLASESNLFNKDTIGWIDLYMYYNKHHRCSVNVYSSPFRSRE